MDVNRRRPPAKYWNKASYWWMFVGLEQEVEEMPGEEAAPRQQALTLRLDETTDEANSARRAVSPVSPTGSRSAFGAIEAGDRVHTPAVGFLPPGMLSSSDLFLWHFCASIHSVVMGRAGGGG